MELSIRLATEDDAVLIADISHQTFYETFIANNRPEDMEKFLQQQFTRGKLILEVSAKENVFALAYRGTEVAGYVKLRDSRIPLDLGTSRGLEIARLYAMTSMIGTGVGKKLMEFSLNYARSIHKEAVWLGVWEKNQRAIDFYTRWGFEKFSETDFLLGDDLQRDWLMRRFL